MTSRALIIAIEEYPRVRGNMVESKLDGVIAGALDFKEWLEAKWSADRALVTQMIFCSEPKQPGGQGASWQEIVDALALLKSEGQGVTDELFVYFSGHGFRFEEFPGRFSDVLVASDFTDNGNLCLKLDYVALWLSRHLGRKGRHYYFIDACRNLLSRNQIQVGEGLPWDPKVPGEATWYILQSTAPGKTAMVEGKFTADLVAGLKGKSKAKVWADDPRNGMLVRYDSLKRYLVQRFADKQPIDNQLKGADGETDAVFTVLKPAPKSRLLLHLKDLPVGESGELKLTNIRTEKVLTRPVSEGLTEIECSPDRYVAEVTVPGAIVNPWAPEVDLFEDELRMDFVVDHSPPDDEEIHVELVSAVVRLNVPEGGTLELRPVDGGGRRDIAASGNLSLPTGAYEATLRSDMGTTIRREAMEVHRGSSSRITLGDYWRNSPPHKSIARHLPKEKGSPKFDDVLGVMDDPDLNLWLTLLGGGRIFGSAGSHPWLAGFHLKDFSTMEQGSCGCYVLAGFADKKSKLRVAWELGADPGWELAPAPKGLPNLRETFVSRPPGQGFLSFQVGEMEPLTMCCCTLPNRVTLVVLTLDDQGAPVVSQFILPAGHLMPFLDPKVRQSLNGRSPLVDLKFVAQVSRAFRRRRSLALEFSDSGVLMELLYAKWLDPVGAALAAYEHLRRGDQPGLLEIVAKNLLTYFPGFPDGAAIARMAGLNAQPAGVPLFADGWLKVREEIRAGAPEKGDFDYGSSLTTWWGAVGR